MVARYVERHAGAGPTSRKNLHKPILQPEQKENQMSFTAIQEMLKHSKTKLADRAIMWALTNRANDKGVCWPSLTTIAKDSGISRRTVSRRLPHIEAMGELAIQSGGKDVSNTYTITLTPRDKVSLPIRTRCHHPRDKSVKSLVTRCPQPRDKVSPESKLNPKIQTTPNQNAGGGDSSPFKTL